MRTLHCGFFLLLSSLVAADTVRLKNGGVLEGVVLRDDSDGVVLRMKHGSTTFKRDQVLSVEKVESRTEASTSSRLPQWTRALETLASRAWANGLRQIPSTVIDKGILRFVPYLSFKAGEYEFNIYGDPDAPAGIEIGIRHDLLKSAAAKQACLDLMLSLLGDQGDRDFLKSLNLAIDKQGRDGLTFEVTPETADDAYGGWWISVYDEKLLEAQRATAEEIRRIAESRDTIQKAEPEPVNDESSAALWNRSDLQDARPSSGDQDLVYRRDVHRGSGGYAASSEYSSFCGAPTQSGGT